MKRMGWMAAWAGMLAAVACTDEELEGPPRPIIRFVDATTEQCPAGGQVILTGIDEDEDGSLAGDEVASSGVVCSGAMGDPGEQGLPGTDILVRTTEEAAGDNCPVGGVRVDVGADDDADGSLQEAEIEGTTFACDGAMGQDGLRSLVSTSTAVEAECDAAGGLRYDVGLDQDLDGALGPNEVTESVVLCAGDDGFESLVVVAAEPAGTNCPLGGARVETGLDGNQNRILDPDEIEEVQFVCDPARALFRVQPAATSSVACPNGGTEVQTGLDLDGNGELASVEVQQTQLVCSGDDGARSLVSTSPEVPGPNCSEGGTRIQSGRDLSRDGTLQPDEVESTEFACNGVPGQDGMGGNAVRVADEPPGANCPVGGVRIQVGTDDNANGALDDAEVDATSYSCDGQQNSVLISVMDEAAGPNCTDGGRRVDVGGDDNQDGVLDPGEVDTTRFVCDTTSTQVPFVILTPSLSDGLRSNFYSEELEALGGTGGNYRWSVVSGSLPPGLRLPEEGTPSVDLEGTLTASGTFTFTVQVEDFFGSTADQTYTVDVSPPPWPCEPGRGGLVGQNFTAITVPAGSAFSVSVRGMAADSDPGGWVYFVEPNLGINRFRKNGSAVEEDLQDSFTQIASGDVGYEIDIDGNNIYVVSDDTACTTNCVYRISSDGGVTLSFQDLADFTTPGAPNDDLRGIHVDGTTMYVITHDFVETELWSIDLSGTLPDSAPSLLATFPDLEFCSGLEGDNTYLYTVCNDVTGSSDQGVARIELASLSTMSPLAEVVLETPSFFTVGTDIISALYGDDSDGDGDWDALYVTGDSGDDLLICEVSGALTTEPFSLEWLQTFSGDDEGMAYDRVNQVLYKVDEGSVDAASFD